MKRKIISTILIILVIIVAMMPMTMAAMDVPSPPPPPDPGLPYYSRELMILGYAQWFGLFVIVPGMLIYIGIKYMRASTTERTKMKGLVVEYVICAVLILIAPSVIRWIVWNIKY